MANLVEIIIKVTDQATEKIKGIGGKVSDSVNKLFKLPFLLASSAIVVALKSTIDAYGKQEEAIAKLNGALKGLNIYSDAVSQAFQEQARAFQSTTTYSNDEIISMQALLLQFGVMPSLMEKTIKSTLDFATATGKDVTSAVFAMGKASGGNLAPLHLLGIEIDKTTFQEKGFAGVLDAVEKKFPGQAEAIRNSGIGPLKSFGVELDNEKERIGKSLIPSITWLIGVLRSLGGFFDESVLSFKNGFDQLEIRLVRAGEIAKAVFTLNFKEIPNINAKTNEKLLQNNKNYESTLAGVRKEGTASFSESQSILEKIHLDAAKKSIEQEKERKDAYDKITEEINKSTMSEFDFKRQKVEEEKSNYDTLITDKNLLNKWYASQMESINKEETEKESKEEEARVKDHLDSLNERLESDAEYQSLSLDDQSAYLDEMLNNETDNADERAAIEQELLDKKKQKNMEWVQDVLGAEEAMVSGLAEGFKGMIQGNNDMIAAFTLAWQKFKDYVVDEIINKIAAKFVSSWIFPTFFAPVLGGLFSGLSKGGIIHPAQKGVVVRKPTMLLAGEGTEPEVISPLSKLPEIARGLPSGGSVVSNNVSIAKIEILFPNVTSFSDWKNADPEEIKAIVERKILPAFKALSREGKMSEVVN